MSERMGAFLTPQSLPFVKKDTIYLKDVRSTTEITIVGVLEN
jgi:hypothetical protein